MQRKPIYNIPMKEEEKKSVRKEYAKHGEGNQQKMMSFKLDIELLDWLNTFANKGRYINTLIRLDKEKMEKYRRLEEIPDTRESQCEEN